MALSLISVITKAKLQRYHTGLKNLFVAKETGKGLSTNDLTNELKLKLDGIAEGATNVIVEDVLTSVSKTNALSAAQGKVLDEKIKAINTTMEDLGTGDMLKSTYDADDSGVVDDAEKLGGKLPAFYATAADLTGEVSRAKAAEKTNADAIAAIVADYLKAADKATLQGLINTLAGRVTTNEGDIATLNGTGEGSVDKKITDAFNDFSTKVTDDGVVNSYKELIDYAASHGAEFTTMVGNVTALQNDHYNSTNLVEITDEEIDAILAS